MWVVQEVVYASHAAISCGRSICWEISQTLLRRFKFVSTKAVLLRSIISCGLPFDIDKRREARNGAYPWLTDQQTLLAVVSSLPENRCTDPRDRIFAVLGLIPKPNTILVRLLAVPEVSRQARAAILQET